MVVSPDDPSWRRNNHRFENIPPNVQGYVWQQLKTPSIHLATLFPDLKMSVIDLVYSTTIPPICDDREQAGYFIPIDHSFFATELPVEDIQRLTLVTVPPKGVVANLVDRSKQQWLDGAESICLPDEPPLPLWVCSMPIYIQNYFDTKAHKITKIGTGFLDLYISYCSTITRILAQGSRVASTRGLPSISRSSPRHN
jgi:hypothetical protein